VGGLAVRQGHLALGFTAGTGRHEGLRGDGIDPRTGSPVHDLRPEDRLLLALPGHERQEQAVAELAHLPPPRRAVFISTVGVYGGEPTGVIDEETPAADEERARSILAGEAAFRAWAGEAGVILRCAGLYGPGRGPIHALARRGYPRPGPPDKGLALIHYDDAAQAAFRALVHPHPQPLYNLVTPPIPTRWDFYTAACAALDLPAPTFTDPLGQPPATYDASRLRGDLLPAPAWPDWRAALIHTQAAG
jgi:nucleoside-diphosphate-sugar epimerase